MNADAALIAEIKEHAELTRALVTRVQHHVDNNNPTVHTQVTNPARWCAIAQTDLQQGYMALVRAVAQPTTF